METKTRFSPTINGTLHCGHLFALLVNEYFAHSRNGKIYIRFDDDNATVKAMPQDLVKRINDSQEEDIKWLELQVDGWSWQSVLIPEVKKKLDNLGYKPIPEIKEGEHKLPYFIRMGTRWTVFPYVCQQTAERVVMDNMQGITHVIRGDDFATEYSLYCYLCQQFDFPTPEFIFLPRLESLYGDISKTNGGYKIADFRNNGYTAEQLKKMIAETCLWYSNNGFELYNIKPNPRINL